MSSLSAVAFGLVLYCIGLASQNSDLLTDTHKIKITGLASGLACSLPVWFAFLRGGVHNLFGITREAAWRIHIVLGWIAILIGGGHGFYIMGSSVEWTSSTYWILGFLGWLLMLIGALPSDLYILKLMRYDVFKLVHYLSLIGYFLVIFHMADHAVKMMSTETWIVFVLNIAAAILLILQKVVLKAKGCKATVQSVEVSNETCGQHIFLQLDVPGYSFQAGQWGHLVVPSAGIVPHPFTIIPLPDSPNGVQFFIKVTGKFTQNLAKAFAKGAQAAPKIMLEGPYGIPAVPEPAATGAVVFVVGGVGVTPVLSLAAAAVAAHGVDNVYLYWSCRSLALIGRCASALLCVSQSKRSVSFTGPQTDEPLPLDATAGKLDLAGFIDTTAKGLSSVSITRATLFCCGPPGLCDAAVTAALKKASAINWHVHVEEFAFLPSLKSLDKGSSQYNKGIVPPANVGKIADSPK